MSKCSIHTSIVLALTINSYVLRPRSLVANKNRKRRPWTKSKRRFRRLTFSSFQRRCASTLSNRCYTKIRVFNMEYYGNLSWIIKSTSRDRLHDYFQWQLISMWADRLHGSHSVPIQRYQNQAVFDRDQWSLDKLQ